MLSSATNCLFFLQGIILLYLSLGVAASNNICFGTDFRGWTRFEHFKEGSKCLKYYQDRINNCTHIVGNLELLSTYYSEGDGDEFNFLRQIEEITGYLLINNVHISRLNFPRLRIIRGQRLFRLNVNDSGYALISIGSHFEELMFPELCEISNGNVGVYTNKRMCYLETINWNDILDGKGSQFHYFPKYNKSSQIYMPWSESETEDECGSCDHSCQNSCWGEWSDQCQKFSKVNCSKLCNGTRCFGTNSTECCHTLCAAGCSGPEANDCFTCKFVSYNGQCVEKCPDNKFSYVSTCVNKCPENTLIDEEENACLTQCPSNKLEFKGYCKRELPSEKICRAPSDMWPYVHSGNIEYFRNCTVLDGDMFINENTFSGEYNFFHNLTYRGKQESLSISKLELFNTLGKVIGTIRVEGNIANFVGSKTLSYFQNVEVIGPYKSPCKLNWDLWNSLSVQNSDFEELDFRNLRVVHGPVKITGNDKLCYVSSVNWTVVTSSDQNYFVGSNQETANCNKMGHTCNDTCLLNGCWGPNLENCVCFNYIQEERCVTNCNVTAGYVVDGIRCVKACPVGKFNEGGVCTRCHHNCERECTGGTSKVDSSGCKACRHKYLVHNNGSMNCLRKMEECPDGYFSVSNPDGELKLLALQGKPVCKQCHPLCKRCTAYGIEGKTCQKCRHYKMSDMCVKECAAWVYADKEKWECREYASTVLLLIVASLSLGGIVVCIVVAIRYIALRCCKNRRNNFQKRRHFKKFRIIDEKDLRINKIVANGESTKTFRGIWTPKERRDLKISVSIKTLPASPGVLESASFITAANILSGVEHLNLLQLQGFCKISSGVMLITRFMPLGCLRSYLQVKKEKIRANMILSWCTQIAKGMEYLESREIVHGNLSAKNVFMETPSSVKITDFGVQDLLGICQEGTKKEEGLLPAKWLALECFQTMELSYQSDVWAFGVTIWEILTYGGEPYEGLADDSIKSMLESGTRLEFPDVCSIELREMLVQTFHLDANARPNFSALVKTLSDMSQDPNRYILILDDDLMPLPECTSEDETDLSYDTKGDMKQPKDLGSLQKLDVMAEVSPPIDNLDRLASASESSNHLEKFDDNSMDWSSNAGSAGEDLELQAIHHANTSDSDSDCARS